MNNQQKEDTINEVFPVWESKFFGPLSGTRCYCGELAAKTLADPAGTLGLCETHLKEQYLAESKGQVKKESKDAL